MLHLSKGHLIFGVIGSHPSIIRWYKNSHNLTRGAKLMATSPVGWNQPYIMGCAADNALRDAIRGYEGFENEIPDHYKRMAKHLPPRKEIE